MQIFISILLFFLWWLFWYIYNFRLLKNGLSTESHPNKVSAVYLLFIILFLLITYFPNYSYNFIFIAIFSLFIFLTSITFPSIFIGRIINSTFQVTWLFCQAFLFSNLLLVAVIFWIGHAPIFILKHLSISGKFLVFLGALILGIILGIETIYLLFPFSFFVPLITHYFVYKLLRPFDIKFKFGIIN